MATVIGSSIAASNTLAASCTASLKLCGAASASASHSRLIVSIAASDQDRFFALLREPYYWVIGGPVRPRDLPPRNDPRSARRRNQRDRCDGASRHGRDVADVEVPFRADPADRGVGD